MLWEAGGGTSEHEEQMNQIDDETMLTMLVSLRMRMGMMMTMVVVVVAASKFTQSDL